MDAREELVRRLYDAHARRDIDGALAGMTADVEWPNVAEGTVLRGHEEARAYWTSQFSAIDPHVEPVAVVEDGDDLVVTVHQVVRGLDGALLQESDVTHRYSFRDGLVSAMRMEPG